MIGKTMVPVEQQIRRICASLLENPPDSPEAEEYRFQLKKLEAMYRRKRMNGADLQNLTHIKIQPANPIVAAKLNPPKVLQKD